MYFIFSNINQNVDLALTEEPNISDYLTDFSFARFVYQQFA